MKYRKTLLLTAFITPFLAGCGADSHTMQNGNSKYQLSARKGKDKMPTESPMLNEIFASIGNRISPGQSQNVSHIVVEL